MADSSSEIRQQLEVHIGDAAGPHYGWDAVNQAMIRHWCEAMGDTNPAYFESEYSSAQGGVQAPPTMMQAWTMPGFGGEFKQGSDTRNPMGVKDRLETLGYTAVVAVNCDQDYFLPIKDGDNIHSSTRIDSISEEKQTALGDGFFVTQLTDYFNQDDEKVGSMSFRILLYKPRG